MRSSKSRSRNKNRSNRNQGGNIVNRVFDSSGPEGKVRGTPQQIIDKYSQLARDAQLSGDRVAVENFQQHSEHYTRMLAAAQKEIDARQQSSQGGNQNGGQQSGGGNQQGGGGNQQNGGGNQQHGGNHQQGGGNQPGQSGASRDQHQPAEAAQVQPDAQAEDAPKPKSRSRRKPQGEQAPQAGDRETSGTDGVIDTPTPDSGPVETPESLEGGEKPKRSRTRKKAPAKAGDDDTAETPSEEV